MSSKLSVSIVTIEREVYSAEDADMVIAPGSEGEMGILAGHEPLMAALKPGELTVVRGDERDSMAIGGGFIQVLPTEVIVMADVAERAEEINVARAEAARRNAERAIAEAPGRAELEIALAKLRRADARLKVARRRQRIKGAPR